MSGDGRVRRARRMAMMCTAIGLGGMMLAPLARPARATPTEGGESTASAERSLEAQGRGTGEGKTAAVFYPPQNGQASPRPVTVLLHGLCGDPRRACAPFVDASTARGWLVCPRGEDSCEGGSRWRLRPEDDARRVEESLGALARDRAGQVDVTSARVLVGFSLGGIAAVRIAQSAQSPGLYSGLVVIASQVHPDAALLKRAGVKRVVLAAGDLDVTSKPLRDDARLLELAGIPTRFVSLGHFGHGYPADMEERMREPMAWVAGSEDGS
jgi:predicted esterase